MKKSILAALLITSISATAAPDIFNIGDTSKADAKVILGMASYHIDKDDHEMLNEVNPSIGFEAWDIQAIYVSKNSWNKKSLYLTYSPDYVVNKYLSLSIQTGIATGYKCSNLISKGSITYTNESCSGSGVVPLAAATVDYSPFGNGFNLSLSVNPSVAMFSVSYDL